MLRAEVGGHVAASAAVHVRRAWEKVAGLQEQVVGLEEKVAEQKEEIAGMQTRADALTRVFTWSTDREWSEETTDSYTFTEGVVGRCFNLLSDDERDAERHWMGFRLEEGPACTMHFKCSILDKNDKVLRVSMPVRCDFRQPAVETGPVGVGRGVFFALTDADKAGAVRADGEIKLRMVVHLYLPE